jgi:phytoene/squalene synthetase
LSVGHYENFPVASALLPARYRHAVVAIYRFARSADDIADEGDAAPAERHAALRRYARALDSIERGEVPPTRCSRRGRRDPRARFAAAAFP